MQFEVIVEFDVGYCAYIVEAEHARGAIALVNAVQPEQYVHLNVDVWQGMSDFTNPENEYQLIGLTWAQVEWAQ
jgi:hypothetical protein